MLAEEKAADVWPSPPHLHIDRTAFFLSDISLSSDFNISLFILYTIMGCDGLQWISSLKIKLLIYTYLFLLIAPRLWSSIENGTSKIVKNAVTEKLFYLVHPILASNNSVCFKI